MREAHQAEIVILQMTILLNQMIAVLSEGILEENRLGLDDHVGIDGQGVGRLRVPSKCFRMSLGILEGNGACFTKVFKGMDLNPKGLSCLGEKGLAPLDRVVGGARIQDGNGVHVLDRMSQTTLNNGGFVLNHEEQEETVMGVDMGRRRRRRHNHLVFRFFFHGERVLPCWLGDVLSSICKIE